MFRIPKFSEICALFWHNKTVSGTVQAIATMVRRLESVANHHDNQNILKSMQSADLQQEANAHATEAAAATAVAQKLNALIAA